MPKSMMDWLGVVGLWLGTVIMALKAGELPLPNGAPAWLASQWWAIVPLPLVTISVLVLAFRAITNRGGPQDKLVSQGHQRPAKRNSDDDGWKWLFLIPLLPFAAMILISGTGNIVRRLQPEPEPLPPPVLQGPVTMAFVRETLEGQTVVQAETILGRYLGQPMRATGRIFDIRGERGWRLYVLTLTDPVQVPQVYVKFDNRANEMSSYRKRDHLSANCIIERLDASGVGLSNCVLIEPPSPEEK